MSSEIVENYIEHLKNNNKPEPINIFHNMVNNDKKLIQELEESPSIARGIWKEEVSLYNDKTLKDWEVKAMYYIHKSYFLKNIEKCKVNNKDIIHKWINFTSKKEKLWRNKNKRTES